MWYNQCNSVGDMRIVHLSWLKDFMDFDRRAQIAWVGIEDLNETVLSSAQQHNKTI
jgi:hypothetical protein